MACLEEQKRQTDKSGKMIGQAQEEKGKWKKKR